MDAIPEEFIHRYVNRLIEVAEKCSPGKIRDACLQRANNAMDLQQAWRTWNKHQDKDQQ